jgi:hypothetical protein
MTLAPSFPKTRGDFDKPLNDLSQHINNKATDVEPEQKFGQIIASHPNFVGHPYRSITTVAYHRNIAIPATAIKRMAAIKMWRKKWNRTLKDSAISALRSSES